MSGEGRSDWTELYELREMSEMGHEDVVTGAVLGASKESGLEVNVDKTKYVVMSPDQQAGRRRGIKTGNKCFERLEQFKYLGSPRRIKIQFRNK